MVTIRHERPCDVAAREAVLDAAYGPVRFTKGSERLRAGRKPADGLAFVAVEHGRVVGSVRLWTVEAGRGRPALLLGPLAVAPEAQGRGTGAALMAHALAAAERHGHAAVLLVGDAPYYGRFGFSAAATGGLAMPGPFDPARLLAREFTPGALDGAQGLITAAGGSLRRRLMKLPAAAEIPRAA